MEAVPLHKFGSDSEAQRRHIRGLGGTQWDSMQIRTKPTYSAVFLLPEYLHTCLHPSQVPKVI